MLHRSITEWGAYSFRGTLPNFRMTWRGRGTWLRSLRFATKWAGSSLTRHATIASKPTALRSMQSLHPRFQGSARRYHATILAASSAGTRRQEVAPGSAATQANAVFGT